MEAGGTLVLRKVRLISPLKGETSLFDEVVDIYVENGEVKGIERTSGNPRAIVFPGFIDLHVHFPQLDIMGLRSDTLLYWLRELVFKHEAKLSDEKFAEDLAKRFIKALIENGTTTAMVFSSIHQRATDILFREASKSQLILFIGKTMMDANSPSYLSETTSNSIRESVELLERWNGFQGKLFYVFTPRFALSCTEELMRETGRLARSYNVFIQSHVSENRDEVREVKRIFKRDYIQLLDEVGLLWEKTVLAHGIHLNEGEAQLLAERKVSIAHCPDSNFFLRSGRFPYSLMREAGVRFGLGSDVGAGTSLYMPYHAKVMIYTQVPEGGGGAEISLEEAFRKFTLDSAEILGLDHLVGSVELGKRGDLVLFSPDKLGRGSTRDILSRLIFRSPEIKPEVVIVNGVPLFQTPQAPEALERIN